MKTKCAIITLLFSVTKVCLPQFINPNFEAATIIADPSSPYYPSDIYASNAIPGWTAYIGGVQQTDIIYNDIALSEAFVSIQSTNSIIGYPVLQGTYSCHRADQNRPVMSDSKPATLR